MAGNFLSTDFPEDKKFFSYALGIFLLLYVLVLGIFVQFPNETLAQVFTIILGVTIVVLVVELMNSKSLFGAQFVGLPKNFLIAIILGTIFGFLITGQGFSILGAPTALTATPFGLVEEFNFLYTVVLAAVGETVFFQGFLYPTFSKLFGSPLAGLLIANGSFAGYHLIVYGLDPLLVFGAFLFGVIANLGSNYLNSLGFGIAAHFVNNFVLWGGGGL